MKATLSIRAACLVLGLAAGWPAAARAGAASLYAASVLTQVAKLNGVAEPVSDYGDGFGGSVAVGGSTIAIGTPSLNSVGAGAGGVLVFERIGDTWSRQAVLLPTLPARGFGAAVAISGDRIVAGAPGNFIDDPGKAHVFVRSGSVWSLEATLSGTSAARESRFGAAVAIDGDTILVGAPGEPSGYGDRAGAVYVFVRSGSAWTLQQKPYSATLAAADAFGSTVAVVGDRALVGAPGDDTAAGVDSGSVFAFERTGATWVERESLVRAGATAGERFGETLSMAGPVAAVGVPSARRGSLIGVVFVFGWTGVSWAPQAELTSASDHEFGEAVSVSGDLIAVKGRDFPPGRVLLYRGSGSVWLLETVLERPPPASSSSVLGARLAVSGDTLVASEASWSGSPDRSSAFVYSFATGGWVEEARLSGVGTTSGDAFGAALSVDGDVMAVGSPTDDTELGRDSGSVTLYERTGGAWAAVQKLLPEAGIYAFGRRVSLSGDLLAVSTSSSSSITHGDVYVFRKGATWSLEHKITVPSWPETGFGSAIAISGDTLLVGEPSAPGEDGGGVPGAVSVYGESGRQWSLRQRLRSGEVSRFFGTSLALRGALALVGDAAYGSGGTVTVFRRAGQDWSRSQALRGPYARELFGSAIAIGSAEIAVGAPERWNGSIYVYEDTALGFALRQRLVNPTSGTQDYPAGFGQGVALGGDRLLAFTAEDNANPSTHGIAFVYERTAGSWHLRTSLRAPAPQAYEAFGVAGAVAGTELLVGSPGASHPEVSASGAVYVFGPASADMTLSVAATPPTATEGENVTFALVVGNDGPAVHPGPVVQLDLDPRLLFSHSLPRGCSNSTGTTTCLLPPLGPAGSASLTVKTVAGAAGTALSTIRVAPDGPSVDATTLVLPGPGADVRLSAQGPEVARRGEYVTYTVILQNAGPGVATGLRIEGPPGFTPGCIEYGGCVIPTLGVNSGSYTAVSFKVPGDYAGPNPMRNTLTLVTATPDPVPGNNTVEVETPLAPTRMLFQPVTPCRLVDTREAGLGGPSPLGPGATTYSAVTGACAVPSSARALAVNVTVTAPSHDGYLKLYPVGAPSVPASFVNYRAGQTRSNSGMLGLDDAGRFAVEVGQSGGTTHVIVDVSGFFQ